MDGPTDAQVDGQTDGWMDGQDSPQRNNTCRYIFEVERREAHSETAASNPVISFVAD